MIVEILIEYRLSDVCMAATWILRYTTVMFYNLYGFDTMTLQSNYAFQIIFQITLARSVHIDSNAIIPCLLSSEEESN